MASGRMIKKNMSKSEKVANLKTDTARMLYFMILPHLDVEGRLEANPKLIKGQVIPLLNIPISKIQSSLEDMHNAGLIVLYKVNETQYLEFTRFVEFQNIHRDREAESEIPPIPDGFLSHSGELMSNSGELGIKLSKDKLSKDNIIYHDGVFENISEKDLTDWSTAYPAVNIELSIKQSLEWLKANPTKEKSNYRRFLTNWFSRTQERGGNKNNVKTTGKKKLFPISGKTCSVKNCGMPAVYKSTSGDFDSYKCGTHLPEKVAAEYEAA